MMPTDCSVRAELDVCIAFSTDNHPVSFFEGDEVVDFAFLIIAFVNRV